MPSVMDMLRGGFGSMMGGAAPAVPADGAMQPTIGPGAPAPAAPQAPMKFGVGNFAQNGGILGLLQGQTPQGLMGMLARAQKPGTPIAGQMPAAGMMPGVGMPGSPMAGPVAPVQLPMNINPADQF